MSQRQIPQEGHAGNQLRAVSHPQAIPDTWGHLSLWAGTVLPRALVGMYLSGDLIGVGQGGHDVLSGQDWDTWESAASPELYGEYTHRGSLRAPHIFQLCRPLESPPLSAEPLPETGDVPLHRTGKGTSPA